MAGSTPGTPGNPDDRAADPALAAGLIFARLLAQHRIRVTGDVQRATATATDRNLAAVASPPMAALVTQMLQSSDNDIAEALIRHVAIARGEPATFDGAARAVLSTLTRMGVDVTGVQLVDGSGLSRLDRVTPLALTQLLRLGADGRHPRMRPLVNGLPVAGVTGTLGARFRTATSAATPNDAAGRVRAKTGTLTGVSALAGAVVDVDGRLLVFAVIADDVPATGTLRAQHALDAIVDRLVGCGCR